MLWGNNALTRPWTPVEIETLQRLWSDGFSASAIALNLEKRSRCAVIGKLYRLGGYKRPSGSQPSTRLSSRGGKIATGKRGTRKRAPKRPRPIIPAPEYIPVDPVRFIDHKLDQCTFIAGEVNGPDTLYCGAKAVFGSSWCSKHITAVWAGIPPKKAGKFTLFRRAA